MSNICKITIYKYTDFIKLNNIPDTDLCISFVEHKEVNEYKENLNQPKPIAILQRCISDKKNNIFTIIDNYILLNKSATREIKKMYNIFNENYFKKCNNSSINNFLRDPNLLEPRACLYILLILSNVYVWIEDIHSYL